MAGAHRPWRLAMFERLPSFLPRDLRELLRFVPERGWDAIEWKPLMASLRGISWQLASGRGIAKLAAHTATLTDALHPRPGVAPGTPLTGLDQRQRRSAGDAILRYYFAQWRSERGLFLDLRSSRFSLREEGVCFHPNGLWLRLDDDFRRGMLDLYRGFYGADEGLFDDALTRMGLLRPDLSPVAAEQLRTLLGQHFGSSQASQRFAIDDFRASFNALFDFFIEHDYRLRSDFVLVGFYLITLYLVLEDLGQPHNVRSLCRRELLAD